MSMLDIERIEGCLVGGAIGDALGWPVEFGELAGMLRDRPQGIDRLVLRGSGQAQVTDDTQMTLFTAEGLLRSPSMNSADVLPEVHAAYRRWHRTQVQDAPPPDARPGELAAEPWLYASRAPGNACMSGIANFPQPPAPAPWGAAGPVNPQSKGCGTVMRSAPFGLLGLGPEQAFALAVDCAQLTHGHPTGYVAAGAMAALVDRLVSGAPVHEALGGTIHYLRRQVSGGQETVEALSRAGDVAEDVRRHSAAAGGIAAPSGADFAEIERVGLGWIAEECLAMAVFCLLLAADDEDADAPPPEARIRAAFVRAVTHSGDSDSVGAVFGNLIGAACGFYALPRDWAGQVEGRPALRRVAEQLHTRRSAAPAGAEAP